MREPSNYDLVVPSRSSSDVDKQNGTDAPKEEDCTLTKVKVAFP